MQPHAGPHGPTPMPHSPGPPPLAGALFCAESTEEEETAESTNCTNYTKRRRDNRRSTTRIARREEEAAEETGRGLHESGRIGGGRSEGNDVQENRPGEWPGAGGDFIFQMTTPATACWPARANPMPHSPGPPPYRPGRFLRGDSTKEEEVHRLHRLHGFRRSKEVHELHEVHEVKEQRSREAASAVSSSVRVIRAIRGLFCSFFCCFFYSSCNSRNSWTRRFFFFSIRGIRVICGQLLFLFV